MKFFDGKENDYKIFFFSLPDTLKTNSAYFQALKQVLRRRENFS